MTIGFALSKLRDSRWTSAKGMCRAPGMCPAAYSTSVRTSITWLPASMICLASAAPTSGIAAQDIQLQREEDLVQVDERTTEPLAHSGFLEEGRCWIGERTPSERGR